jgi:hypothetical protein
MNLPGSAKQANDKMQVVDIQVIQAATGKGRVKNVGYMARFHLGIAAGILRIIALNKTDGAYFRQMVPGIAVIGQMHRGNRFKQKELSFAGQQAQGLGLGGRRGQRFFQDDMFAGLQGLARLLKMQTVGSRDVHGVNRRVSEHRLKARIGCRNAKALGQGCGSGRLAGTGCDHLNVGNFLGGVDHGFHNGSGTDGGDFHRITCFLIK